MGQEIKVFIDHNNITYETIERASKRVQCCKSLIQEFGVNLLYIKGESNLLSDAFIWITMAHRAHKLADTTLEEYNCELVCMD